MQAVATQWKHDEIAQLEEYLAAPVVALVDVSGIPARQMMEMRKSLREHGVRVRMSRNRLLRRAIEAVAARRPGLEKLADAFRKEQLALLTSDGSPFTISRLLKAAETLAPARGGEVAGADVVVEKGVTPFPAGPIVGEFQQAGFPAVIVKGQIEIRKRHVAVAGGDTISAQVAAALTKLEIYPVTMGMELLGAYDGQDFYPPEVLDIDYDEFHGRPWRERSTSPCTRAGSAPPPQFHWSRRRARRRWRLLRLRRGHRRRRLPRCLPRRTGRCWA